MTPNSRPDEAQALLAAAARDRLALDILARDAQAPAEIALFLAQQTLEKAIKAVLALHGVVYRRTHDLLLLEALARDAGVALPVAHFLLVSQFTEKGTRYTCRPDLVGFVNGLPWVVIDLKKPGACRPGGLRREPDQLQTCAERRAACCYGVRFLRARSAQPG